MRSPNAGRIVLQGSHRAAQRQRHPRAATENCSRLVAEQFERLKSRCRPFNPGSAPATPGETGIDSGAVVEVFANEADATARSEYIQGILQKAGPAFGTEWHHQKGNVLLRVSGVLSPSVNDQYKAAAGS